MVKMMKKAVSCFVLLIIFLFANCNEERGKIEYMTEDGITVIHNPVRLYSKGYEFNLKKEYEINLKDQSVLEAGLAGIYDFDIDSEGNVYIVNAGSYGDVIYKFDSVGKYLFSFCRVGQGPGETGDFPKIRVTDNDEISIAKNMKILFFSAEGKYLKEVRTKVNFYNALYLENGNYLIRTVSLPLENDPSFTENKIILYDSHFNEIKILGRVIHENVNVKKLKGTFHNLVCEVDAGKIFIGNQEEEYEIKVYDYNGKLVKKIKKDYKKIPVSEEYKKRFMSSFNEDPQIFAFIEKRIYFPDYLPPFHYFTTDEKGRIYVMTYEKGTSEKEYVFDIFNELGAFVGRKVLNDFSFPEGLRGKFKNNRFYCVEMAQEGFEKLTVYTIIWE